MSIILILYSKEKKKGAPFWNFSFNHIESPCNDIMKQPFKFQKKRTVIKNNGNFEIVHKITTKKGPFLKF